jgi:hypothetical protein
MKAYMASMGAAASDDAEWGEEGATNLSDAEEGIEECEASPVRDRSAGWPLILVSLVRVGTADDEEIEAEATEGEDEAFFVGALPLEDKPDCPYGEEDEALDAFFLSFLFICDYLAARISHTFLFAPFLFL